MAKKKTIKYLENGEYHDATVKDVGVIEELKTESKDNLVEAINEIFLGGGKGFSDLQQKVDESTQAAQNAQQATDNLQQAANNLQQRLEELANEGLSDEEAQKIINQAVEDAKRAQAEALQAYKDAQKELDDSMAQFMEEQKVINRELEQAKADIQGDIDQKNNEIEQINAVIESTKSDLTATSTRLASVRNDLTNAQMDWGKVRTEITNINGKLDSKMSNTDFDEYKERIERNETEITQTKNELQSKATKQDLDVLTGTVTTQGSSITQLAGKIEQKVSKDTLANDIDDFQVKKANIFTGTREFMGWEFSDKALGRVNDDIYNHAKVAELHNGSNLSITVDGLEVGRTYSVSIFAKASANSNTSGVKVTVDNGKSYSGLMRTVYTPHDTKVTTNWQRYYATIVASATTMKFVFDRSGITSDITLYLNRPKLEVGETVYAWEDNAQDIYKRVEHTEAQFDVYNDQISGIVKRQTETDKKIENVSSTFSQRADGIEANAKKYTNDKVTGLTEEFSGRLRATSEQLSTEYEKQTNAKIGALSDGGSNLILNSSFLVTDNNGNATLENWRDTSSKVSLTKPNGLDGTWIKVNRATTGTVLGARSNYFPVKQGKLVVGVDVALDGTGNISPYVLRIEYYDVSNNRVNYEDITLQKLGLSASQITKSGSNFRYARGVYKTSNDRSDVAKACIVVPETITGYDMYLTNFFAKFSDVNDGTYEVNPLDQQASLIKQRTKIEQDSEKINLLNTQTEKLGNDIKATNTSVNVLKGEVDLKASQSTVNDLTNRVAKNAADIKVFPDKIKSEVSEVSKKVDGVNDKVDNIKVGGTNLIPHSEVDTIRGDTDYWVFSTGNINNYGGRYNPTDKSLELEAHIKDTNYQFLQWQQQNNVLMNTELAHLQVGDVLTISAEVYIQNPNMSGNITLGFRVNPRTDYNSYFSTERGIDLRNLKTGWQRVSATGTITQKYLDCMNDVQLMRILLAANGLKENNKIAFRKIKAEKGNIATDWSPATEDTDASIESVKTVATQTKDGFDRLTQKTGYNASTGEFSKITTQINEGIKGVSTQVSSVSNRLDNLSVGGVNLMRNTTRDYVKFTGGGWGVDYLTPNHQAVDTPVEGGETYTFSAWVKNDSSSAGRIDLEIYQYNAKGENKENGSSSEVGVWVSPGEEKRLVFTKTLLADTTRVKFHTRNRDKNGTVTYWTKMAQVEKGNIVTDWSPATEDLQEGIDIATTKATQTNTKFEHMISQIQYNDSTGEIGKYEHKITELANGTQEKISAIRLDSDKKLQSATQTLTNKIGDLESTVRTNTTNLGQYRQEMTNSAKEWSTKFTSVQTDMSSVSNRLDNLSQTNLYYNSEFTYTGSDPHNMDSIQSSQNVAYSRNDRWANYKGSNAVFASTRGTLNDYYYIEHKKDKYVKVQPGEVVSASVVTWVTGGSDIPRDGYALCTISFYKDLSSGRMGYKEASVAAKDIAYPNYKTLKVENVTVPDGANYMTLLLIIRGASNWQFSQPMLVKSDKVGAYVPSTQLQLNQVADKTDSNTDKIEILSGKITANSNEFSTVYSKITNVQDITNSAGGGINLAKHTSNKLANVTASPWLYVGSEGSSSFNNLKDYQGKYMTVRVWIEKPSRDTWVRIWTDKWAIEGNVIKAGQSGYSTVSGVIPTGFSAWNIPIGNSNNGTTTTFGWKEFKIELGNVATPWSPNPDDVDNNIDTAANNARTNAKNDAVNAIKSDSQWQSMGKIVTNASFLQNSDGFAQEVSKRIVGSTGQTNLYYNSEFTYSGNDNHNVDGIISTGNIAYSVNGLYGNYRGSNSMCEHTTGGMTDYKYIEHTKDNYVKVSPGEIISGSVTVWTTGDSSVPRDGHAICTISFYKDLSSSRMGYKEVVVAAKDIAYPNYKTLKVENVTVPSGANYMALHLIVRGAADWHFSQPMLVKDDHVGVYVPSTQLQLNDISSRTQFLQDDEKFLLRVTQAGGATKADVNSVNSKIGDLQGQITVNANKFNTVFTKIVDVDNKITPLNKRTEFLQDNSQFLLRVQEAGAATGGVNNLLTNSDTFDGYSENNTNSFDFQKIEGSGLPSVPNQPSITMTGHVWNDYGSAYNKNDGIYLENGETYWFGVYLMTDSNAGAFRNLSVYASSDKGQTSGSANKYFAGEVIDFNRTFNGKTKTWVWNTYKFTGDGTTRYNWRIEPYNHIGGSIWTAGYMLVKSPFPPTGWSPNMTDVQMRLDSGGVTINGNTKINGILNAKGMVLDDKTGSKLEFNSSGLDISYSQNREQYFTFGGNGLDFWRMSRDEAMDDYPDHHKPGYVHLGSMLALDNEYTNSVNRPDQQHTNAPSNNNGIGFVIDVTGGADNFAILQKGAEYRKGEKWGRINFNDTVNNSHFPIWEINATGYGSHAWLQSGFNRGRGIFNYSNLYFYTDPVIGTEHDPDGKDYFPIERIGLVGNDGWGGLAIWADNKNIVSIRTDDEYPIVANGMIMSKHAGADDSVFVGGDGRQWLRFINRRNVRADVDKNNGSHYTHFLGSAELYELKYGALTHTSQLSRKTDISLIDINDLSSKLLSIDLFKYKYKSQKENEKYRYGGIIDDVNEVKQYNLPQEFISTSGEGIDDSNLITGLIATAKIQAREIEKLNFRILELERGKING